MKTVNLPSKLNSHFDSPFLSLKVNVVQQFSLATLQKKRGKEYGFISYFLDDALFPQRKFVPRTNWNLEITEYSDLGVTFETLVKEISSTMENTDLLMRVINSLLLKKEKLLNCFKEKEIVIPIISVKKDVRGFYIIPSLKHRSSKWEWWANVATNKIEKSVLILSLQNAV